ncbi:polysaccharide deacetylase family protein [Peptoniphilus sp. GNH]|nr:polysaccharide deacetylase family protein [Peptoniphilus sp. GNH]
MKKKFLFGFIVVILLGFIALKFRMDSTLKVITFHSVRDSDEFNEYVMKPERFEKIIEALSNRSFKFLSMRDVKDALSKKSIDKKSLLITFDDGYKDNYTNVLPILKKYKARATVFVIGSKVGTPGYLSWQDIREMYESGCFDIESHSYNLHDPFYDGPNKGKTLMSAPLDGESDEHYFLKLKNDLIWNNSVIYRYGTSDFPFAIAYPGSMVNDIIFKATRESGLELGFVGAKKLPGKINKINPLAIPRMHVKPKTNVFLLVNFLSM